MAIDTTKKVTAISVDGVQMEIAGTKERIKTITLNPPTGANYLEGYVTYDKGVVLLYGNMVALYEFSTGATTKLCDLNVGVPVPNFRMLDNKRCFIYGTSVSTVPYPSDVIFVDLETKTARNLISVTNSQIYFGQLTNDKYVLSLGAKTGGTSELNAGTYEYSITGNSFTAVVWGGGNGVAPRSVFSTGNRIYFGNTSYYDIQNDTFTLTDRTGFSANYPTFVKLIGSDIILIWDTYSGTIGGCGYYVISENKCYNFAINGTNINRLTGLVEFSNHNFVLASSIANSGLLFFDYNTKELSQITNTGAFFVGAKEWAFVENDVFVSIDNTGQLVEIDNQGNSHISTVTVYASSLTQQCVLFNNKLYLTKQTQNFGIWEYDYTTHTATQIVASNGYLANMFVMDGDLYLSSYSSSPTGIYKVDITNQTTTQVFYTGYQYTSVTELADGYYAINGNGQKVLYNSSTNTFSVAISNNYQQMGTVVTDMGTYGMFITPSYAIPNWYLYNDSYYTYTAPGSLLWIYNKNTHQFLSTFANLGTTAGYTYNGNALAYGNDKALALGNPTVKFEVTSNNRTYTDVLNNRNTSSAISGSVVSQETGYAIIKLTIGTTTQLVKFNYSTEQFEAQTNDLDI